MIIDLTEASNMTCTNKKSKVKDARESPSTMFLSSTRNPNERRTTRNQKIGTEKEEYKKKSKGTSSAMKSKLKAIFKGFIVRKSIHKERSNKGFIASKNIGGMGKNDPHVAGLVLLAAIEEEHHKKVAASSFSSPPRSNPLTASISTRDRTLPMISCSSTSSPAFSRKEFAPPLEQTRSNRVNFTEFIFSIPRQALHMYTSTKLSLDECGSNPLHLACFHGTTHDAIMYISDNCRHETQQYLLTTTDRDGNLPSHILVSSICHQKIDLADGLKTLKYFYEICPEAIFEFNSNEELVTDVVYKFRRSIHEDSSEFLRIDTLYKCLRDIISQVWLKRKLRFEEMGHEKIDFDAISSTISSSFGEISTTNAMKSERFLDENC